MFKILIGIPVFNNLEITKACLHTLLTNTDVNRLNLTVDVLIVDNGSHYDLLGMILNDFNNTRFEFYYLRNPRNMGVAIAWNQILRFSPGIKLHNDFYYDYYVVSNNDVFFGHDWLQPLINTMESDGKIGWLSALENGSPVADELIQAHDLSKKYRIDPKEVFTANDIISSLTKIYCKWGGHDAFCHCVKNCNLPDFMPFKGDGRSAVCFVVKPQMVEQIGLFDEAFAPVGISEDLEYFLRMEQVVLPSWLSEDRYPKGDKWKCGFCGQSIVHHHWCSTHQGRDFDGRQWDREREKNWQAQFGRSKKYYTGLFV
jgi:GT2 family glycosyltransferase